MPGTSTASCVRKHISVLSFLPLASSITKGTFQILGSDRFASPWAYVSAISVIVIISSSPSMLFTACMYLFQADPVIRERLRANPHSRQPRITCTVQFSGMRRYYCCIACPRRQHACLSLLLTELKLRLVRQTHSILAAPGSSVPLVPIGMAWHDIHSDHSTPCPHRELLAAG